MLIYFALLFPIRIYWAWYAPIMDCDETFNYWEPLHYFFYGNGLQTWEYSPDFALRSYAYILAFYSMMKRMLPLCECLLIWFFLIAPGYQELFDFDIIQDKIVQFHLSRSTFGLFAAIGEAYLCESIRKRYGNLTCNIAVFFFAVTPAIAHSAVAFLPTSTNLILSYFILALLLQAKQQQEVASHLLDILQVFSGEKPKAASYSDMRASVTTFLDTEVNYDLTNIKLSSTIDKMVDFPSISKEISKSATMSYAIAYALIAIACSVWPYVAISFFFFSLEILNHLGVVNFTILSVLYGAVVIGVPVMVDSQVYENTEFAIWNQIDYNVRGGGSTLYGTDGPLFYIKNLFVNFNFVFPSALVSIFMFSFHYLMSSREKRILNSQHSLLEDKVFRIGSTNFRLMRDTVQCYLTLLLVLVFFSILPHKEERFLSQIYALVILCAAISLSSAIIMARNLKNKVLSNLLKATSIITILLIGGASFSRNLALVKNLNTMPSIYEWINYHVENSIDVKFMDKSLNVCMGKDWYFYPSSFYLPKRKDNHISDEVKILWYDSEYEGLLPQPYGPFPDGLRTTSGTFNDKNQKELAALSPLSECTFIVEIDTSDSYFTRFIDAGFNIATCNKILNLEKSTPVFRSFYDFFNLFPEKYHYADLCLLYNATFRLAT